jgi:hypothetical protein
VGLLGRERASGVSGRSNTAEGEIVAFASRLVSDYSPFALVVYCDGGLRNLPGELRPLSPRSRPLRQLRAEVGTWCRRVGYVAAAEREPAVDTWEVEAAERLWGCRCRAFSNLGAALQWIVGDLGPAGAVMEPYRVWCCRQRGACVAAVRTRACGMGAAV